MLPTRDQWKRWSLPAKWGFVGGITSLVGLALTLLITTISSCSENARFRELLADIPEAKWAALDAEFDLGYVLYYFNGDRKIHSPRNVRLEVEYKSAELVSVTPDRIVIRTPDFTLNPGNLRFDGVRLGFANHPGSVTRQMQLEDVELYLGTLFTSPTEMVAVFALKSALAD